MVKNVVRFFPLTVVVLLLGWLCLFEQGVVLRQWPWGRTRDNNHGADGSSDNQRQHAKDQSKNKLILGWYSLKAPEGEQMFKDLNCKVQSCTLTYDKGKVNKSDAVIVRIPGRDFSPPPRSSLNQRWIFVSHESPVQAGTRYIYDNDELRSFFNWTMTYRIDSDLYFPWGYDLNKLHGKEQPNRPNSRDLLSILKSKPKLVGWIVSHCGTNSKRREYVRELQKYIPVDIYGDCGEAKTPFSKDLDKDKDDANLQMINQTYLFYLSFENSLCVDYVTEKFFKMLPYDVIPIVRSGADYTRIVPHKWYIDTRDFESPKDLGKYLEYLQKHPEEMLKYFEHKEDYQFGMTYWYETQAFCTLCEKLNNPDEPVTFYEDIGKWWGDDACVPVTDIPT